MFDSIYSFMYYDSRYVKMTEPFCIWLGHLKVQVWKNVPL